MSSSSRKASVLLSSILGLTAFGAVLIAPEVASAKLWRNAYVSFELPDNWNCVLEQTEWVCRSEDTKEAREAIIILTAKEVGPMDSFEAYMQHLNTPQQISYRNMGASTSRIIYQSKRVSVNDQQWIDGLHLGSEVPSYFTRYLATIKDRIAVLVTFSAHRDHYARYSSAFFKAVQSLRVIATKNLFNSPDMGQLRPQGESLGGGISGAMPSDLEGGELGFGDDAGGGGGKTKMILMVLALVLAAGGGYIFWKSKKK